MLTGNPFTSTKFVRTAARIESRDFDGHRVDVLRPKLLKPDTPVLLIHDGMNVFFRKFASSGDTWQIREALAEDKILGDPLVVAIWGEGGTKKYNPRRINEFLCDDVFESRPELWETLLPDLMPPTRQARGNYFLELVCEQILPEVLLRYGLEHSPRRTALAGCSVAGVASIYWLAKRPQTFGAAFSLSSHWEFGAMPLIDALVALLGAPEGRMIWTDAGTEGLDAVSQELNDIFANRLLSLGGWELKQNLEAPTFWGTGHHETFWAERVRYPINWWLKAINEGMTL